MRLATIAVEGTDQFDGISRGINYVFVRPGRYLDDAAVEPGRGEAGGDLEPGVVVGPGALELAGVEELGRAAEESEGVPGADRERAVVERDLAVRAGHGPEEEVEVFDAEGRQSRTARVAAQGLATTGGIFEAPSGHIDSIILPRRDLGHSAFARNST